MTALDQARAALSRRPARIALVGANNDPRRYGNIILRDMRARGYTIVPVNHRETVVEGLPVAASLAQVDPPIDIINVVIPPPNALEVVEGADPALCPIIWFQPGAFDDRVVRAARARFEHVLAGDCIMVVARQVPRS